MPRLLVAFTEPAAWPVAALSDQCSVGLWVCSGARIQCCRSCISTTSTPARTPAPALPVQYYYHTTPHRTGHTARGRRCTLV